ncbi:MAG: poly-gamma-glutamate hydrolase family protein [Myxococcota bacterium]
MHNRPPLGAAALLALLTASPVTQAADIGLYHDRCKDLVEDADAEAAEDLIETIEVTGVNLKVHATTPGNNQRRREQVVISQDLADALEITDAHTSGPAPQIRLISGTDDDRQDAVFTVGVIEDDEDIVGDHVWLYGPSGDNDEDNGVVKLLDEGGAVAEDATVTVQRVPVSSTVVYQEGETPFMVSHYDDVETSRRFLECVDLSNDPGLAVIAPHGGDIEIQISNNLESLLDTLDDHAQPASAWDASGMWGDEQTYRRWHITSTQLDPISFPGLGLLEGNGPYEQVLALHGYKSDDAELGVLIGGTASQESKCYFLDALYQVVYSHNIKDPGSDLYVDYTIHVDGLDPIVFGDELTAGAGLGGTHDDNIANRLLDGMSGLGSIQLEMSAGLRKHDDFDVFMDAIATGMAELIELGVEPTGACRGLYHGSTPYDDGGVGDYDASGETGDDSSADGSKKDDGTKTTSDDTKGDSTAATGSSSTAGSSTGTGTTTGR